MLLLEKVFKVINESNLDYCIQNKYEMMPEEIPSDIDMMYRDASEEDLDNLVNKVAKETGLIVTQKICQGYFEFQTGANRLLLSGYNGDGQSGLLACY